MVDYRAGAQRGEPGSARLDAPLPNFQFEVVRSFEDGDQVFMQIAQNPEGDKRWVTMSLLQVCANGSGNMLHQVSGPVNANVNADTSRVGGPREIDPNEDTARNKDIVREFVTVCFERQDLGRVADFLAVENFESHNPHITGGADGFRDFLEDVYEAPTHLRYAKVHDIVGQHNYVAVFADVDYRGGYYAAADLFRLDGGLIVEHWDIAGVHSLNRPVSNDMGRDL